MLTKLILFLFVLNFQKEAENQKMSNLFSAALNQVATCFEINVS